MEGGNWVGEGMGRGAGMGIRNREKYYIIIPYKLSYR